MLLKRSDNEYTIPRLRERMPENRAEKRKQTVTTISQLLIFNLQLQNTI